MNKLNWVTKEGFRVRPETDWKQSVMQCHRLEFCYKCPVRKELNRKWSLGISEYQIFERSKSHD